MNVPTVEVPTPIPSNASSTDDEAILEKLIQLFAHLLWYDYLGFALQFCFTFFGSFINGLLLWVLSSCPGKSNLVDLVQMHMAACDIFGCIVTSILLCVSRVILMHDVVEGFRIFAFFVLSHVHTMSFEDISTILISAIRFKQVTKLLFFFRENSFFPKFRERKYHLSLH